MEGYKLLEDKLPATEEEIQTLTDYITKGRIKDAKNIIDEYDIVNAKILLYGGGGEMQEVRVPILHYASQLGFAEVVRYLCGNGADIEQLSTPFLTTALHAAASGGDVTTITILCDFEANLNAKDWLGETPLMNACRKGHTQAVKYLLHKGADVTLKDGEGKTALDHASKREIIDCFTKKGGGFLRKTRRKATRRKLRKTRGTRRKARR